MSIRILLLADTHLWLGEKHFAAYERALEHAGEVDLVAQCGDVLYRSRVKPGLVFRAFAPLKRIADRGVPVVVVPGNHERSAIPFPLLAMHPVTTPEERAQKLRRLPHDRPTVPMRASF